MEASEGFPPIARNDARILVLGSLPGVRSLEESQYYAHPRNGFWPIMRTLFSADGDYQQRCSALTSAGIAVWDVLQRSVRPGSLDADIQLRGAVANNFEDFLERHSQIRYIAFNGKKAEALFRSLVLPSLTLEASRESLTYLSLPSTSPAYAAMAYDKKQQQWCAVLRPLTH